MADGVEVVVDPGKEFQAALKVAAARCSDMTPVLDIIGKSWFQSNRAIYTITGGPGKWEDLKPSTQDKKEKYLGFIYPIFRGATRNLENSITDEKGDGAIFRIIGGIGLELGTSVEYAHWLQDGTKNMKARPFILVGAEQTGPPEFNVRLEGWLFQIQRFFEDTTGEEIGEL